MDPANIQTLTKRGIGFAEDGTVIHKALIEAKKICQKCEIFNRNFYKKITLDCKGFVRSLCRMSTDLYAIIKTGSLYAIWDVLSKLQLKPENRLSTREASWRMNDLALDIQDFYEDIIPKSIEIVKDLKSFNPDLRYSYVKQMRQFSEHTNLLILTMDDLDQRLSVLMHSIEPTSAKKLTQRIDISDQVELIANSAALHSSRYLVMIDGKKEFQDISRLNRRMLVLLEEAELTKLSEKDEQRYNLIKTITIAPEGDPEEFRLFDIVNDMETLIEEVYEHNQLCKKKCCNNFWLFERLERIGESTNNYCTTDISNLVLDTCVFINDIFETFQLFSKRLLQIQTTMYTVVHRKLN